ncbi:MAG: ABC transporter permease, partial [Actinomycetes bacterium]
MLSFSIATRFLRKSPMQSILIAAGIAIGIGVQVFLGSLITSLQTSLVDQTIGHSPQVIVQSATDGQAVTVTPALKQAFASQSQVTTAVPTRVFSAIYRKGKVSAPLQFTGGDLAQLDTIYDISGRMSAGTARLGSGDVLVGKDFAAKNGLKPGGTLPLVLPSGKAASLTIAGVFDFGSAAANSATAF